MIDAATPEVQATMKIGGTDKLTVYTMIFQTFVFLQLFNMINARKLGTPADPINNKPAREEFNVFRGFFNNWLFIAVIILCSAMQFGIVYLGGEFLRVDPLNWKQQLFALGLGFSMLPWNLVCKLVPSAWFVCCGVKDHIKVKQNTGSQAFSRTMRKYIERRIKIELETERRQKAMQGAM